MGKHGFFFHILLRHANLILTSVELKKKINNINWKKDFDYTPHDGVSKSYQSKKWIKAVDLKSVTGVSVMFSSIYAELSA